MISSLKQLLYIGVAFALCPLFCVSARAQDKVSFRFPIATREDADESELKVAGMLNEFLSPPGAKVWQSPKNPGCAFWVQRDEFAFADHSGYLIRVGNGGAVFAFSDLENAKKGIERLKASAALIDGAWRLPIGILTNYPVVGIDDSQSK